MNLKSYAKINLGLDVLSKRDDGYHEIQTIFYPVNLFDNITLEPYHKIVVECFPDLGITPKQNLAFKTSKLLQKKFDCKSKGVYIKIEKNIPDGAGLGGGSSNAATILLALNDLWGLNLTKNDLIEVAKNIGADVPFFLYNKPAIGEGIGEKLNFIDFKMPFHIVLVTNQIKISTDEAYHSLDMIKKHHSKRDYHKIAKYINACPYKMKDLLKNDFEKPIFTKFPKLKEIKELLYQRKAIYAQMSGSGSTIFGFFKEKNEVQEFQNSFKDDCAKVIEISN